MRAGFHLETEEGKEYIYGAPVSQSLVNEGRFPLDVMMFISQAERIYNCRNPSLMRAGFHTIELAYKKEKII